MSESSVSRLPAAREDDPRIAAVWQRLAARGRSPLNLHRTLAHAPPLLDAVLVMAEALRHEATTSRRLRELVILRTAQLEESAYELAQHVPMARAAGIADAEIAALPRWREAPHFDARERAALALAENVVAGDPGAPLPDDVFTPGEIVELTVLSAFYLMTARVVATLDIRVEAG